MQWWLSRRYAPESVASGLVFGSVFHAAVEAYYRGQLRGEALALPELLSAFQRRWAEEAAGATGGVAVPVRYGSTDGGEAEQFALIIMLLEFSRQSAVN